MSSHIVRVIQLCNDRTWLNVVDDISGVGVSGYEYPAQQSRTALYTHGNHFMLAQFKDRKDMAVWESENPEWKAAWRGSEQSEEQP